MNYTITILLKIHSSYIHKNEYDFVYIHSAIQRSYIKISFFCNSFDSRWIRLHEEWYVVFTQSRNHTILVETKQ